MHDAKAALKWFEKAAVQGHKGALSSVGFCFRCTYRVKRVWADCMSARFGSFLCSPASWCCGSGDVGDVERQQRSSSSRPTDLRIPMNELKRNNSFKSI